MNKPWHPAILAKARKAHKIRHDRLFWMNVGTVPPVGEFGATQTPALPAEIDRAAALGSCHLVHAKGDLSTGSGPRLDKETYKMFFEPSTWAEPLAAPDQEVYIQEPQDANSARLYKVLDTSSLRSRNTVEAWLLVAPVREVRLIPITPPLIADEMPTGEQYANEGGQV